MCNGLRQWPICPFYECRSEIPAIFVSKVSTVTTADKPSAELCLHELCRGAKEEGEANRIAAFMFLWFFSASGILYKPDSTALIGNNTLVALTRMIAESRPEEMGVMIKIVVNLRNKQN